MLGLTRKTDYAIIALSHMAQHPSVVCGAREIAHRFRVPAALLMNVLKTLCQADLIRSTRGAKGGYVLAVPAEKISLATIISVVEGPVRLVPCATRSAVDSGCDLIDICPVAKPVRKVHAQLEGFLDAVTLAQIAHDPDYSDRGVPLTIEGASVEIESAFAAAAPVTANR